MTHLKRSSRIAIASAIFALAPICPAAKIQLDDGRVLVGALGQTSGVADDPFQPGPSAGEIRTTPILIIDDGLRRTYVHKTAVREVLDEGDTPLVKVRLWQNHAERGSALGAVGAPIRVTPFDEFGRRITTLAGGDGEISVVQGITEITPVYTRVRGLRAEPKSYVWDQRIATSSVPRKSLARILAHNTPADDLDARIQVVRLYVQSGRYDYARQELEAVQADFGGRLEEGGFDGEIRDLRQSAAERLLDEIELRAAAGQHRLVRTLLRRFPAEGVPGESLQRVRELLDADDAARADQERSLSLLTKTSQEIDSAIARGVTERIVEEITERLSPSSTDRLTAYRFHADAGALNPQQLAALAISGWLLGPNGAVEDFVEAVSLVEVRDNLRAYLVEPDPGERERLYLAIRDADGAAAERVAKLLRHMAPPLELPPESEIASRCYEIFPPRGEGRFRYRVQLPPEYDPLRAYPTLVTLPPIGGEADASLDAQLDYWAGAPTTELGRVGQAMRRGYVVLAVDWAKPDQLGYGYSSAEHAAVLVSLRDAMRRVSIDTDRVYLTGHGDGGDLAWDLALAHPDTWAGVVPLLAVADRYCGWYWENGKHVPWRLVNAELDAGKVARNSRELDRYLRPRFDATVVEYRGRGYDPLGDEVQRALEWMARKRRGTPPEEFECATMRPWDNYFWWVELEGIHAKSLVTPAAWPPKRGVRAARVRARISPNSRLNVFAKADKLTVWLSPELIDFGEPLSVEWNGRSITEREQIARPDLRVLLEDARTRADRRRPYWAKLEATR